jgi:hypothetical protein
LEHSIRGWEAQGVDLNNIGMCAWISGERERGKNRNIYNNPSHVLVLGIHTRVQEVPYMEDFADMQLDVSVRDCLTGMWKAKMGNPPNLVSLYPGSIKSSFTNIRTNARLESRVVFYPRISRTLRELLIEGWAYPVSGEEVLSILGEISEREGQDRHLQGVPLRQRETTLNYHAALQHSERETSDSTSRDSGSLWRGSGDEEPWRQALEEMKRSQEDLTARVHGLEGSLRKVESDTTQMAKELNATGEIVRELREDSIRLTTIEAQSASTNSAVMRMEEMMMRMLTGGSSLHKGNKVDEIESEIATMRLSHRELRNAAPGRLLIEHTKTNNA